MRIGKNKKNKTFTFKNVCYKNILYNFAISLCFFLNCMEIVIFFEEADIASKKYI